MYGDQIQLINNQKSQWKLSVSDLVENALEDGLEVNASEVARPLKLCHHLDNQTREENERLAIKGKYVLSGDIITIMNRNLGGLLCIKRKGMLSEFLDERTVAFIDSETNVKREMKQDYFEIEKLRQPDTLDAMYKIGVDKDVSA